MDLTHKQILVLGGGFAGVRVALDLAKKDLVNTKITIVSRDYFHEYHPDLYEVASAFLPETGTKAQKKLRYQHLRGTVTVPLNSIFQNKNVEVIQDSVKEINLKEKLVLLERNEKIRYDFLVIALGSTTNFFGNKKLEEKSLPLKSVTDALNIRDNIDELFLEKKRNEEINIVVGGGGFSGCELAGEMIRYVRELAVLHNHPKDKAKITIVESCPNLLNGAQKWAQDKAFERLQKLGVHVSLGNKIVDIEKNNIILEDGKKLQYDILVWTAGIKANPVVETINGVKLEKNVCLAIDKFSRIIGSENVFAIGDNSYCYDYLHSCIVPPTAQLAIAQGKSVAVNIAGLVKGKGLVEFHP
ncbi:MAG: FAD-dependent oxidoreductase, partial [Candidatus Magasanikbacteria bacterium]|nr:FAD-dependent oxidoreductase [Candidatus Magasanikbacteria bacterium]